MTEKRPFHILYALRYLRYGLLLCLVPMARALLAFDLQSFYTEMCIRDSSGPTRLAGRPGRNEDVSHPCSSLRPSERINHCVHLHGLTSAASRPPPPMGGRGQALCAAATAAAPS